MNRPVFLFLLSLSVYGESDLRLPEPIPSNDIPGVTDRRQECSWKSGISISESRRGARLTPSSPGRRTPSCTKALNLYYKPQRWTLPSGGTLFCFSYAMYYNSRHLTREKLAHDREQGGGAREVGGATSEWRKCGRGSGWAEPLGTVGRAGRGKGGGQQGANYCRNVLDCSIMCRFMSSSTLNINIAF